MLKPLFFDQIEIDSIESFLDMSEIRFLIVANEDKQELKMNGVGQSLPTKTSSAQGSVSWRETSTRQYLKGPSLLVSVNHNSLERLQGFRGKANRNPHEALPCA